MKRHIVLVMATRIMVPFILIFSLYVLAHGEISPGGGFQGGVIFAAGWILYSMVFGKEEFYRRISRNMLLAFTAIGVMIYTLVGYVSMFNGGTYLEYAKLPGLDMKTGNSIGLLLIEIGVFITVFSVMLLLFFEVGKKDG
ncbi:MULTISPECIES: Na(+)/H(+) antiporter subunit B [Calditerrivibrio]|jgi:multicomponent Na+:H+ antiporter subunit B|uniref:Sodium:proton antiporter n=1 Tax=Calditerrivibrio nitroreducens TaxID=477976 RepID=A0A2J6WI85_9BACT|nr:MAG: sodium:proton antiporter [Calditerrivibrio nitroreducens]